MAKPLDHLTQTLRERILDGAFEPGAAVREMAVADTLGVSRTLARLALGVLEQEGLLIREPNRGFRVRSYSLDEVADAIEVRGELEALAARLAAERGLAASLHARFSAVLAESERLTGQGFADLAARSRWIDLNAAFHDGIVEAAGNGALAESIRHVCRVPLAGPRAIVFNRTLPDNGLPQVRAAHDDHVQILDAILNRQGQRAASLIREHAYRSARNKRANVHALHEAQPRPTLPGLALVRTGGAE
jgi:GntR family transcriptional regulator of vanillate catabolism